MQAFFHTFCNFFCRLQFPICYAINLSAKFIILTKKLFIMETRELLKNSFIILLLLEICVAIIGMYKAWRQTKHPEFMTNLKENHKMFFICIQTLIIATGLLALGISVPMTIVSGSYVPCIASAIFIIMLESLFLSVKKQDNPPKNVS